MKNCLRVTYFLLAMSCLSLFAQEAATPDSARDFVQRFYGWYVPVAAANHSEPSWVIALKQKGSDFSRELYDALKNDADAQRKVEGDIVGLDFDPFLNTQDACKRYELGKVSQSGAAYRVEVFGVCSGKKAAQPDVAPEVRWTNGHWEFVNFYYPNQMKEYPKTANLLAMLDLLKQERQKSH